MFWKGKSKLEFSKMFIGMADAEKLPALFHCTTGKDRTGWSAAALLTLLGVPKDQVYEDYLRSNDNILPAYKHAIDPFVEAGGDPEIPAAIERYRSLSSRSRNMASNKKTATRPESTARCRLSRAPPSSPASR